MAIAPTPNEATTRAQLIDTQLAQAGWSKSRRGYVEEFLLAAREPEGGFERQQFADYVLLGSDGSLALDETDYKTLIVKASDTAEKLALAQKLATRRLAVGVLPQLDACFAALGLAESAASNVVPLARQAQ